MKCIRLAILLCVLSLASPAWSAIMIMYDKNWQNQYYIKDGQVFDLNWNRTHYLRDDRVYDLNWQLQYYLRERDTAEPKK